MTSIILIFKTVVVKSTVEDLTYNDIAFWL